VRHASFFSGVGGLDLGFERAGIHTVSVSEIDPYANAVLAERFPDAPNLGSITEVDANDIPEADIWSGGFPCQDLSVAGKRAGFAGKRSSLAFTFLDLVEQRRPRWIVLENVPGLFSSNKGADFGRLLYEMEQLRYGVSWRTLDARYFGVAQRRRRVFIVASLESDRAGEVLFECEGCERHPSPRQPQRQGASSGAGDGSGVASALTRRFSKGVNSTIDEPLILAHAVRASLAKRGERGDGSDDLIISQATDADRVRAADGVARRLDNQQGVAATLTSPQGGGRRDRIPLALAARKSSFGHYEMTEQGGTLKSSGGDIGGGSENIAILSFPSRFGSNANVTEGQAQSMAHSAGAPAVLLDTQGGTDQEDDLLPVGLDSHRYRCCGNGVVAPVAEWIGRRIVDVDRRWREEEAK
jgi:DNA (cytosine-5)-methyltransferase 1